MISSLYRQLTSRTPNKGVLILFLILVLFADLVLSVFILLKVRYTEIDWRAYMQEVGEEDGYLSGQLDYTKLKGDTGPLVYPAGFVYIYSALYYITEKGTNIFRGQFIFLLLYMITVVTVMCVYYYSNYIYNDVSDDNRNTISSASIRKVGGMQSRRQGTSSKMGAPMWIFVLLILGYRIHSLYMLRMFNDCIAILLGYFALLLFQNYRWRIGSLFYSLAVSVKMNMLLQAPGLLMLFLMALGVQETLNCLFICGLVQLILGYPFLSSFPVEYIMRSFDLSRVFEYKWTVNWRFLSEELFLDKTFHTVLLFLTLIAMILFVFKWTKKYRSTLQSNTVNSLKRLSPSFIALTLMTSNFIGIAFARSLHYQFYVWYFHSLPLLLWSFEGLPTIVRLIVLAAIEYPFSFVYPATAISSAMLQASHVFILACIAWFPVPELYDELQYRDDKKRH